jgi:anionic cell wall polymer biosynthesis LytR-Cps2A-Psr (LCP) family protein
MLNPNNLTRAGDLYNEINKSFKTNLPAAALPDLVLAGAKIGSQPTIRKYVLSATEVSPWVEPETGAQVLLPNQTEIEKLAKRVIGD